MRRVVLSLLVSALVVGVLPSAVSAAESPRPKLRFTDWRPTEAAGEPGVDEDEWVLWMKAKDPDGVITEVEVRWADEAISFAHTYCVQGSKPGTVSKLGIGHAFSEPGVYKVRVRAMSQPTCGSPPDDHQVSRWNVVWVVVPESQ